MAQPVTIKLGYLTRKESPNGTTFLQGDLGNLRITIVAEPAIEPSQAGDMIYAVHARMTPRTLQPQAHRRSPLPGRHPFEFVPAPARVTATELAQTNEQATEAREIVAPKPMTKAEQFRAAAQDAIARHGAIPPCGDRLDDIFPVAGGDDVGEDEVDLLFRPLI